MRMYTTLAASAVLLTGLSGCLTTGYDPLGDATKTVADAGYPNPTCVHSYLPNAQAKRPGDAKGQLCTSSDGRTAWVNGSTVTEAK